MLVRINNWLYLKEFAFMHRRAERSDETAVFYLLKVSPQQLREQIQQELREKDLIIEEHKKVYTNLHHRCVCVCVYSCSVACVCLAKCGIRNVLFIGHTSVFKLMQADTRRGFINEKQLLSDVTMQPVCIKLYVFWAHELFICVRKLLFCVAKNANLCAQINISWTQFKFLFAKYYFICPKY